MKQEFQRQGSQDAKEIHQDFNLRPSAFICGQVFFIVSLASWRPWR
jgi:hypothetical protein